jgi:biofilm PGA synthesis protein PgaA
LLATNALPEAEKLARRLAATAPGNQGLQIDYATLLQARGLPRAAEQTLKMAEALEPSNLELEQQQAYVAMDLQEWRQMDLLADDVVARAPRDRSARRLDRLRTVHHMSELRLNASKGLHSDNPVSGTHDLNWDATLYGPPIADNWRLFAGTRYAEGNFDEGKGTSRHLLGGIEWRPRDLQLEAELSATAITGRTSRALASQRRTASPIAGRSAAALSACRAPRPCGRYATGSAPTGGRRRALVSKRAP